MSRTHDLGHTRLDVGRACRTGIPEAIFAAGKTPAECRDIVTRLLGDGADADPIVVTRTGRAHLDELIDLEPDAVIGSTMVWRQLAPGSVPGTAAVVSGGTSDRPVVDECAATLTALGVRTRVVPDVGVAGLHRLTAAVEQELHDVDAVVAVAGMEAALATVLGGLVPAPIVAVPTSVGYGTTFEGLTALLSLMSSCAPGITVVGIDNGYGAACAVVRILSSAARHRP